MKWVGQYKAGRADIRTRVQISSTYIRARLSGSVCIPNTEGLERETWSYRVESVANQHASSSVRDHVSKKKMLDN